MPPSAPLRKRKGMAFRATGGINALGGGAKVHEPMAFRTVRQNVEGGVYTPKPYMLSRMCNKRLCRN